MTRPPMLGLAQKTERGTGEGLIQKWCPDSLRPCSPTVSRQAQVHTIHGHCHETARTCRQWRGPRLPELPTRSGAGAYSRLSPSRAALWGRSASDPLLAFDYLIQGTLIDGQ